MAVQDIILDNSNDLFFNVHNKKLFHPLAFYNTSFSSVFPFSAEVEPSYTGARIDGEVVTLDFVKKMMEDFKNQKCIHKRCGKG